MILFFGVAKENQVVIIIKDNNDQIIAKKLFTIYRQSEKLLPEIEKLLKIRRIKLKDLKKIEVENSRGSFTSLRICVAIANALGYALNIPVVGTGGNKINNKNKINKINKKFNVVEPIYDQEPNITVKKRPHPSPLLSKERGAIQLDLTPALSLARRGGKKEKDLTPALSP